MSTTSRDRYHHGDLPGALVAEATAQVRASGADAVRLRAVARAVGVDPAAVYRHLDGRDGLLAEVARAGFVALATRMEAASRGATDPADRLRAVGAAYMDFAVDEPSWFRLMFGPLGAAGPRPVQGVGPRGLDPYALLVEALEGLHAAGRLAMPRPAAEALAWSAVHGLADLRTAGLMCNEDAADAVLGGILRAVDRATLEEP